MKKYKPAIRTTNEQFKFFDNPLNQFIVKK